jgi:hypothetical protein
LPEQLTLPTEHLYHLVVVLTDFCPRDRQEVVKLDGVLSNATLQAWRSSIVVRDDIKSFFYFLSDGLQ